MAEKKSIMVTNDKQVENLEKDLGLPPGNNQVSGMCNRNRIGCRE